MPTALRKIEAKILVLPGNLNSLPNLRIFSPLILLQKQLMVQLMG